MNVAPFLFFLACIWGALGAIEHYKVVKHIALYGSYKGCWGAAFYWYAVAFIALCVSVGVCVKGWQ